MIDKPSVVFDREHEWDDLTRFALDERPGLRVGIVRGRRRHGKSFLLEHLCRAVGGTYTLALRQSRAMALDRFTDSISRALGYQLGRFADWATALDASVDALIRAAPTRQPLLVLDEFPYLVVHSPELPSAIQALYDQRGPASGHPAFRMILCGSAISVMSTLLAGDQALYGRAMLDLRIGPLRFRDSADYWRCAPDLAFLVDAVLGGAPGYRDLVGDAPEDAGQGFADWLGRSILNPSHVLFNESDYLLAEDPRVGDRAIYHSIWEAVARGAHSPTQIGAAIGMDAKSLGYHLGVMNDGGFIQYGQDILWQRRPVITVADPAVRFHQLLVRPNQADLELREADEVWRRSQDTFASKIVGPHFEQLSREWLRWYGRDAGLPEIGPVGTSQIKCLEHQSHEVDVIALDRASIPRAKGARIVAIGEAKATRSRPGMGELERLSHIRELLVGKGRDAAGAMLLLFSRYGFTDEVRAAKPDDVRLVALNDLYRRAA